MPKTLVSLLTDPEIRQVISRFYEAVYADPLLAPMFAEVGRQRQEQRLAGFVQMAAEPGSEPFDGPYLRDAHSRLQLNDALFEHRRALLVDAIRACGHGEEVVAAWSAFDERWRAWVLGTAESSPRYDSGMAR